MIYNLILNGMKEFYPKTNNIQYNVLKVDNKNKMKQVTLDLVQQQHQ